MHRRDFLHLSALTSSLVLAGQLPLLAAERRKNQKPNPNVKRNIFAEPPAIEPITGFLDGFRPVASGAMKGNFEAHFDLIKWGSISNRTGFPKNTVAGSLKVLRKVRSGKITYRIEEIREGQSTTRTVATLDCRPPLENVIRWKVVADVLDPDTRKPDPKLRFIEEGTSGAQAASPPLISQFGLLALLAKGAAKSKPLRFDMLGNGGVLKPNQVLNFSGRVDIPNKRGSITMDCYAQTGYGILPTHYLVDSRGRVQLITQEDTNWALNTLLPL